MVVSVTSAAHLLGPKWAGLVTGFPVNNLPVIAILHFHYGVDAIKPLFRVWPAGVFGICLFNLTAWLVAPPAPGAFELSPTILAITNLDDGRLLEVNEAFLRTTGYTRAEIIGRPVPELGLWVDPSQRTASSSPRSPTSPTACARRRP